jgi:sugar phosphate isomerase/epimerase
MRARHLLLWFLEGAQMSQKLLPVLGASLFVKSLELHRDWLSVGPRNLELQDPIMPSVLANDPRALIAQARAILGDYRGRVGIHGPFIGFSLIAGFDPDVAKVVIHRLTQALDFASELGAEYVVIHSPFIGFGASPFSVSALPKDLFNEIGLIHAVIEPLLKRAEAAKCRIVIENVQDNNSAPLCDLVRSFDSPFVRVSIDVGHAFITHQHGGPTPDQWVRDAGPLLAHMHIQDTDGQTDRHWAPGQGSINWHALFEEIRALESAPLMVLELRDHLAIEKGAGYLIDRGLIQ